MSVGPSQPAPSCPSRRPTLRSGHQSHRRRLGSDMYHVGVGNNAGEATRVCGLEGVERPPEYTQGASPPESSPRAPACGGSTVRKPSPSPHTTAPHKSHLQAGGTLQPPHFLSQALSGKEIPGVTAAAAPGHSRTPGELHAPEREEQSCAQTCQCSRTSTIQVSRLWCKGGRHGGGGFVRECIGSSQGWKV